VKLQELDLAKTKGDLLASMERIKENNESLREKLTKSYDDLSRDV